LLNHFQIWRSKMIKQLDDYRYNEYTKEVVHIIYKYQRLDYTPKKGEILYGVRSNKPDFFYGNLISSKDQVFWCAYIKISKAKAILLW